MKFLIATEVGDSHSIIVSTALEHLGQRVFLWYRADCPSRQTHSIRVGSSESNTMLVKSDCGQRMESLGIDLVWMRRPAPPVATSMVKPHDLSWVNATWDLFGRSLEDCFGSQVCWINRPSEEKFADSKPTQLSAAKRAGLAVPETLISNDPEEVRNFVARFEEVVYKPLMMLERVRDNRRFVSRARRIVLDQLGSDTAIRSAPSIFQRLIKARREIRVTVMGDWTIAVSIAHKNGLRVLDWRNIGVEDRRIEVASIPESIIDRCKLTVSSLGLMFACVDLIESTDGEYFFLEANPSGQFLWVEQLNPEIRMLSAFCSYLTSFGDEDNIGHGIEGLRLVDIRKKVIDDNLDDLVNSRHVKSESLNVLTELNI